MIAKLDFPAAGVGHTGAVRRAGFVRQSTFPLAAVCMVASLVRERLAQLLAIGFNVDVIEPAAVHEANRRPLFEAALAYRLHGASGDAFIIVRPADAARLIGAAFAENERPPRAPLSEIEALTFERIVAALAPDCATLCGPIAACTRDEAQSVARQCQTYFEVRLGQPLNAAIGFGMAFDPPQPVGARLTLDDLRDIEIVGAVTLGRGALPVSTVASLQPGEVISLATPLANDGTLTFSRQPVARGPCGTQNGRLALRVSGQGNPGS